MKKALLGQEEVFLWRQKGRIGFWSFDIQDVIDSVNEYSEKELGDRSPPGQVLPELREWILRFFDEGTTDSFLDDLNSAMQEVIYRKYVLPLDLLPSSSGYPRNGYIADLDTMPSVRAYAADEFSKILSSGMLKRVKQCQMEDCERLFVGRPQAKWCSKTCGSKHRVRSKRRRDAS